MTPKIAHTDIYSCSAHLRISVFPSSGPSQFLQDVSAAVAAPLDAHHDEQLRMERGLRKHVGKLGQLPSVAWCWQLVTSHRAPGFCRTLPGFRVWARTDSGTQAYCKEERGGSLTPCRDPRSLPLCSFWGCVPTLRGASRDIIPRALLQRNAALFVRLRLRLLLSLLSSAPPSSTCRAPSSSLRLPTPSLSFLGNAPCRSPLPPLAKPRAPLSAAPDPTSPSPTCRPRISRLSTGETDQPRPIPASTVSLWATTTPACVNDGRHLAARRPCTRHPRPANPTPPLHPISTYPHPGAYPLARAAPRPLPQCSTPYRSGPPCHAQRRGSRTCTARPSRRVCACHRSAAIY